MSKSFFVAPGHEAVNRGVWHRSGLLLTIEEGETVDIYATSKGVPDIRLGTYRYEQLDAVAPPIGLIRDHRNDTTVQAWSMGATPAPA
ncbi:MAG: hypothetical protein KIT36_14265 [Alphaproteobacteria bacterium]|nr:hypothetical protein [Alphaproteobacteria bacterium]